MKPGLKFYTGFKDTPSWFPEHYDLDLLALQAALHMWLLKRGFSVQFDQTMGLFIVWSSKEIMVATEKTIDEAMIHVYKKYLENELE